MTFLLDVSILLAWLWDNHEHHSRVLQWQKDKSVAVCPIVELGFLRISTQPAFGASMDQARAMLAIWRQKVRPRSIPCDLAALDSDPAPVSGKTTDFYLASLAERRGMRWATLDESVRHRSTFVFPR